MYKLLSVRPGSLLRTVSGFIKNYFQEIIGMFGIYIYKMGENQC